MRKLFLLIALPLVLVLTACTERQTCESRARNHLRDINLQIDETEDNLSRGYTLVKQDFGFVIGTGFCSHRGNVRVCTRFGFPAIPPRAH